MQEFSTRDGRHYFTVDKREYFLPAFDVVDIDTVSEIAKLPPREQVPVFRDALAARAKTPRSAFFRWLTRFPSPADAVHALSLAQVSELFKSWAGVSEKVSLGESSGSVD